MGARGLAVARRGLRRLSTAGARRRWAHRGAAAARGAAGPAAAVRDIGVLAEAHAERPAFLVRNPRPARRGLFGGSAPAHHPLHSRCTREARKYKIIVQNHPNTSSKVSEAAQRAAELTSNSVNAKAR